MIEIIAHRGFSALFPENTLPAFEAALLPGVAGIECDLQASADGQILLFHDRQLGRLGRPKQTIGDLKTSELLALDAGSWKDARFADTRLMTLDELLKGFASRTRLLLEIKRVGSAAQRQRLGEATLQALTDLGQLDRHEILSFDQDLLLHLNRHCPTAKLVLNSETDLSSALADSAWQALHALSFRIEAANEQAVRRCREAGLRSYGFTCNTRTQREHGLAAGLDVLMTDHPPWLLSELQSSQ
jgi:glycerophosphoryl diester phosphodiesterase